MASEFDETPDEEVAEQRRLETLRSLNLLDTEPEEEFDELARLVASVCSTPVGAVTLIDEKRSFIKAAYGEVERVTSRDASFCTHALHQSHLMVVPDATLDDRFSANPHVLSSPGVRFYAGMPLKMSDGNVVGTLCVIDQVPRELTPFQEETMAILSRQAVARMELRQQRVAMQAAMAELQRYQGALEEANRRLQDLSLTDALTGLSNRRAFEEGMRREMARSLRQGSEMSLVMMDIDNFKQRNDRFGHVHGDEVLRRIGTILRESMRIGDLAARYGGEEFALLLPDTGAAGAAEAAARVQKLIQSAAWPELPLTMSLGVATLGKQSPDKSALVALADDALYQAKRSGKNRVVIAGNTQPS